MATTQERVVGRPRVAPGSGRRLQRSVQVPFIHESRPREHHIEALLIFLVFAIGYGLLGYWMVVDHRVVSFSSIDRLTGAYLAWHGDPAKLAAVGFNFAPLQSLVLIPFAVIASLATNMVALPIASAIFGGATMVVINRMLHRCDMPAAIRYPVVLLVALTPTVAFYSSTGGAEMIGIASVAAALSAMIAWYRTVDTRYLITAAAAFAVAAAANYVFIVWMVIGALGVASILARHGADDSEMEGSVITFATPALYGLALWCLINWLIVRSPFGWIGASSGTSVNIVHNVSVTPTLGNVFIDSFKLAFAGAPLAFIVIPGLIFVAIAKKNELATWFAVLAVVSFFTPAVSALIHSSTAEMQLSSALPTMIISVIGAGWIYQSLPDLRALSGIGLIVGLIVSIVLIWHGMNTYKYQDMEQAFHSVISGNGTPAETIGGRAVGIELEQQMATYIRDHVKHDGEILTDNSQTYAVILTSAKPKLFRTRLLDGKESFETQVDKPPRGVKYFLVVAGDTSDAINQSYPEAWKGDRKGLSVVYSNKRYVLLSVAPGTSQRNSTLTNTPSNLQPVVPVTTF